MPIVLDQEASKICTAREPAHANTKPPNELSPETRVCFAVVLVLVLVLVLVVVVRQSTNA